ncbi:MAG: hypothetical protein ICV83_28180, partial [Cytophagales bacterium]|nr:hypothetical protein [Cytophagales bacterium]
MFKLFSNIPSPDFVVGPKCVRPGDTVTYSINSVLTKNLRDEIGIDTYTWVYPNTWDTLYFSSDRSSITLKAPQSETFIGPYDLRVYVGKCNTPQALGGTATGTVKVYDIVVNKKPEIPMLTADAKCIAPSATGKQIKRFTIANYESGLQYKWEIPSNWTFVNGTPSMAAQWADIEIDNLTGTIRLSATRAGCDAVSSDHKVTRALTTARNTIDGQICVGGDSIKTYTLLNAPNDSKFKWTFQANGADQNTGWMFDGDVDKQTVLIKVGATGGTLSVNSVDCPGVTISLPIKVVPKAPTLKNGQPCLAAGTSGTLYEINPVAGAVDYKWVISGGMLFSNGQNTFTGPATQVSVTVPSTATSGTLTVTPTNGTCFDSKHKLDYIIGISPATPALPATTTVNGVAVIFNPTCYNANVTQELTFRTSTTVSGGVYEWQVIDLSTNAPTNKWTIKSGTSSTSSTAIFVTAGTSGTTGSYRVQAGVKA